MKSLTLEVKVVLNDDVSVDSVQIEPSQPTKHRLYSDRPKVELVWDLRSIRKGRGLR